MTTTINEKTIGLEIAKLLLAYAPELDETGAARALAYMRARSATWHALGLEVGELAPEQLFAAMAPADDAHPAIGLLRAAARDLRFAREQLSASEQPDALDALVEAERRLELAAAAFELEARAVALALRALGAAGEP